MGIQPFNPGTDLYEDIFSQNQVGHGALGRYRGSDLQNGSGIASFLRSMFSRVARFATPLIRNAMPHVKSALESAKPHLGAAATSLMNDASKELTAKISRVLAPSATSTAATPQPGQLDPQSGSGRRKRIRRAPQQVSNKRPKKRSKFLQRIPPFDLPDSF